MSEPIRTNTNGYSIQDPAEFSRNMMKVAAQSQRLITDFLKNQSQQKSNGPADPLNLGQTFVDFLGHVMRNPGVLVEANFKLWQSYLTLWHHTAQRMMGQEVAPLIEPSSSDKRFKDKDWSEVQIFNFIKQSYLLTARWMQETV